MARKFGELRAQLSPEAQERAAHKTERMLTALELRELVRERGLTQEALAERLETAQSNVSRLLRREDMHLSTLREVIEALGGELLLTARFPDREYPLRPFGASEA